MGEKGEWGCCLWIWVRGCLVKEWTEKGFEDEDRKIALVEWGGMVWVEMRETNKQWIDGTELSHTANELSVIEQGVANLDRKWGQDS